MATGSQTHSIPVWSRYHPQIPQRYIPQWTQDMENRTLILENCKLSNYPCGPHDKSIYLVHRERLNNVEPQKMVNSKSIKVPRERLLRPWFHSPLSRYQSSLMFRKTWYIHSLSSGCFIEMCLHFTCCDHFTWYKDAAVFKVSMRWNNVFILLTHFSFHFWLKYIIGVIFFFLANISHFKCFLLLNSVILRGLAVVFVPHY